jgi:hypothetical protein
LKGFYKNYGISVRLLLIFKIDENSMKAVLFVPLNPNHVLIFRNIIQSLNCEYEVLCHDRISDTMQCRTEQALIKSGIHYQHAHKQISRSLNDGVVQRIKSAVQMKYAIRSVLSDIEPTVVILALDNDPIAQIAINEAKHLSIKTVLVPEGLLKPYEFTMKKKYISGYLYDIARRLGICINYIPYGSGGCDRILVSGKRSFEVLKQTGIPEDKMMIVGQQKYDDFINKVASCNRTDIKTDTYLYAASTRIFNDEKELRLVRGIVDATTNLWLHLIVKIHPRSEKTPEELYQLLKIDDRARIEIVREGYDTFEILRKVDGVITISSAIVLEALMMNKECIAASYLAGRRRFDYDCYDAIHVISDESDIRSTIEASVKNKKSYENKKRLLEDEIYRLDGRASERTAKIIENML